MCNPVYEQIQARKLKARLLLQHAQRVSANVSQTCAFFAAKAAQIDG